MSRRILSLFVLGGLSCGHALAELELRDAPLCQTPLSLHRNALSPVLADTGGGTFAIAYRSGVGGADTVQVARLDGSGAITAGPVSLVPATARVMVMGLAWNGSAVGVLFSQQIGNSQGIFFRLLSASLAPVSGVLRVDEAADAVDTGSGDLPSFSAGAGGGLVWDGTAWGATWSETPADPLFAIPDVVKLTRIAANGRSHGPVFEISDSSGFATFPSLVWTGSHYGVAFVDDRSGADQLHYRRVATDGSSPAPSVAVTAFPVGQLASGPAMAWNGSEIFLAWVDRRDGGRVVYSKRLSSSGAPLSGETRLTDAGVAFAAGNPVIAWAGDRWVLVVEDFRPGDLNIEVRLSFADVGGAKLGSDVLVSSPLDPFLSDFPALAWSAGSLLVAWHDTLGVDGSELHAQAFDATGSTTASRQLLTAGHRPGLGSFLEPEVSPLPAGGWAVAWVDQRDGRDGGEPTLSLIGPTGAVQGVVETSDLVPALAYDVAVAVSPDVVGVAWSNALGELRFARFSHGGLKLGADHVEDTSFGPFEISLGWTGSAFFTAWSDRRDGNPEIYTAAIAADGTVLAPANRITNDPQLSRRPTLAAKGSGALLVWEDSGGTAGELAIASLDATGALSGGVSSLTPDDGNLSGPAHLATDGSSFGVAYRDEATGTPQVLLQRLDATGVTVGSPTQLSSCTGGRPRVAWTGDRWTAVYFGCAGLHRAAADAAGIVVDAERVITKAAGISRLPALAWDGSQAVLAASVGLGGDDEVVLTSLACATDDTPPVCPTGLSATPRGNDIELAWGPGFDADFALRWHYVDRDGRRIVALPAQALGFTDPLPPPGPHTYRVSAVNQGLLESPSCPEVTLSLTLFYDGFESGDTSAWSP